MNQKADNAERFRRRMAATIKEAVQEGIARSELNIHERAQYPPPADLDAEQELCAAVLNGVPPSSLELAPGDFYAVLFRSVFASALACERHRRLPTPQRVAEAMLAGGALGPIAEEVQRIAEWTPLYHVKRLRQQAARVKELRKRRELLRVMARLDAALRTDGVTHEKALEVLKRYEAR